MNIINGTDTEAARIGAVPEKPQLAQLKWAYERATKPTIYDAPPTVEMIVLALHGLAEKATEIAADIVAQLPGAITMPAAGFSENNPVGSLAYVIRTEYTSGRSTTHEPCDSHWSPIGHAWGIPEAQFTNLGVYRFLGMVDRRRGIFIPVVPNDGI